MALVRKLATAGDLFDEPPPAASTLATFQQAFERWLATERAGGRLAYESSAAVYADMWRAFARWCRSEDPPIDLDHLGSGDLERFLASRHGAGQGGSLSSGYAWRMLKLIDRVQQHRAVAGDVPRNDAAARLIASREALRTANLLEPPPDHLPADDARHLVTFLSRLRPGASSQSRPPRWQDLRNCTAVALHLGAGLTPGDVRALPLDAPVVAGGRQQGVPWKLQVPGNGNRPPRETPLAPWAGQLLKHWLEVRAAIGVVDAPGATARLFPGTRRGSEWGKVTHYDAVKAVLDEAGIHPADGGAFRLRHTFALRQLRRGRSLEDVGRWMGILNAQELERYRRVLVAPVEVV